METFRMHSNISHYQLEIDAMLYLKSCDEHKVKIYNRYNRDIYYLQ